MIHPQEAVDAVAQWLFDARKTGNLADDGQSQWHWDNESAFRERYHARAAALLDQIAPMLVAAAEARERLAVEWADAREACIAKTAADVAGDLKPAIDRLAAAEWALFHAIRERGAK